MKLLKFLPVLPFWLVMLFSNDSFAQYPGMRAVYADINRQFMAQQMQMRMSMLSMSSNYGSLPHNYTYTFHVTLKDSTKQEIKSKIYLDTTLHKNYLILENKNLPKKDSLRKQKIYPGQTKFITREGYTLSNKPYKMVGIANDSCWLFKAVKGSSISVYSFLSEDEDGYFNESTLVAIQQSDGPVVKLTVDNLTKMIEGDPDANKALQDKKYMKAIKIYNKNIIKNKKADPLPVK